MNNKRPISAIATEEEHEDFIEGGVNERPFNSGPAHTDFSASASANGEDPEVREARIQEKKIRKFTEYIKELFPQIVEGGVYLYVAVDESIVAVDTLITDSWSVEYFKSLETHA